MTAYNEENGRDWRVILAWIVLALQIIGLLWLLLFARDRLGALGGAQATPTAAAVVEATTAPEPTAVPPTDEPAPEPTVAPEPTAEVEMLSAEEAGVIRAEDAVVDTGTMAEGDAAAPEWLAQVVEGVPPDGGSGTTGFPSHLLLGFPDAENPELQLAAPDAIDLNQPQVRVVPIAALLAWLEARGDTAGQEALDALRTLLEEQPAADQAAVPLPPVLAEGLQAFVSRMGYATFDGGEGVGYVAHVAGENATPVTNESGLNYIYQGLSDDGQQYIFMSWPVDADFLPETAGDAADAEAALTTDAQAYYDDLAAQVEAADESALRPGLRRLAALIGTLGLAGRAAAAPDEAQVSPGAPEDATGIVWNWTASRAADDKETAVENPPNYTLVFWPDGTFSFKADCNVGRGTYTTNDDGSVSLALGPTTAAACPEGSQDADFLQTLMTVQSLGFDESGDMILSTIDGRSAVFANVGQAEMDEAADAADQPGAAEAGFTGLNLQWPGFSDAAGDAVEVDDPENYTIALLPDGTFTFRADCNVGAGTYTYGDDGALQLDLGPMTAVACPEDSQSDTFLGFLNGVNGVSVADDGAVSMTTADGGSATFITEGPIRQAEPDTRVQDVLAGKVWQWTDFEDSAGLNDLTVENPESYLLIFQTDGSFTLRADCNVGRGSYTRDSGSLSLEVGPMTRALCPEGSLSDTFVQRLGATATYVFDEDDNLVLNLFADSGNMVFARGVPGEVNDVPATPEAQPTAESAGLTGVTLQWPGLTDAAGTAIEVENPENYYLVLLPDGTFTFKSDCNLGNGTYTYDADGNLSLRMGAMTLMACPEGSQADAFLAFLNNVTGVTLEDDGRPTLTTADGSSATFVNVGAAEAPEAQAAPEGDLPGINWQWIDLTEGGVTTAIENPDRYTLALLDDGSYVFVADCNRGSGGYTLDGATLTLGPAATTLAACGPGSLSDTFIGYLGRVTEYGFDGDNLLLTLDDGTILTLANGGPFVADSGAGTGGQTETADSLAGTSWRWFSFRDAKQAYDVPATAEYTIAFNADGTINVVADCNSAFGNYTVNADGTLTVSVLGSTLVACPAGSLGGSFVEYLNQAGTFAISGSELTITLMADGGTMRFVPAQ